MSNVVNDPWAFITVDTSKFKEHASFALFCNIDGGNGVMHEKITMSLGKFLETLEANGVIKLAH